MGATEIEVTNKNFVFFFVCCFLWMCVAVAVLVPCGMPWKAATTWNVMELEPSTDQESQDYAQ